MSQRIIMRLESFWLHCNCLDIALLSYNCLRPHLFTYKLVFIVAVLNGRAMFRGHSHFDFDVRFNFDRTLEDMDKHNKPCFFVSALNAWWMILIEFNRLLLDFLWCFCDQMKDSMIQFTDIWLSLNGDSVFSLINMTFEVNTIPQC